MLIAEVQTVTFEIGANLSNVIIVLLASIPGFIAAYYARQSSRKTDENIIQTNATHDLVNSQSDKLIAAAQKISHAEGMADQKAATAEG